LEDDLKALIKPQYVDQIPKAVKGVVREMLDKKAEMENQDEILTLLGNRNFTLLIEKMFKLQQIT
jgi:ATP-binding cassette subfamily E protein 1